jgi:hypothetical protein
VDVEVLRDGVGVGGAGSGAAAAEDVLEALEKNGPTPSLCKKK